MSEQKIAAAPSSAPPAPPPADDDDAASSTDLLGIDEGGRAAVGGGIRNDVVDVEAGGEGGRGGETVLSPSGSAAAAVMAEGLVAGGVGGGVGDEAVEPTASAAAAADAAGAGADADAHGDSGVDTESSGSTEESESSESENDEEESSSSSSDEDGVYEDDDGSSSEDESGSDDDDDSSSSEDPSVVGMDMRKSPPETLGGPGNHASAAAAARRRPPGPRGGVGPENYDYDEDPELGVLTKEQVLAGASSLLGPSSDPRAVEAGEDFYAAYGDVARGGDAVALSDSDDTPLRANNRYSNGGNRGPPPPLPQPRGGGGRRTVVIGQDRATVRQMVAQRAMGKRYNNNNNNHNGNAAAVSSSRQSSKRGKNKSFARKRGNGRSSGRATSGRETTERLPHRRVSRRAGSSNNNNGGGGSPRGGGGGWSNPTRKRMLFCLVAAAIGIAGLALIGYGVARERAYNNARKDDDYFYNDDFFDGNDDDAVGADVESQQQGEKSPITAIPEPPAGSQLPPPPPVPFSTPPPAVSTPAAVGDPTHSPSALPVFSPTLTQQEQPQQQQQWGDDDELLAFLKQSYADSLGMFDEDMAEHYVYKLDRGIMEAKPPAQRSVQWKAYEYLLERRDVVEGEPLAILMNRERVRQLYALTVWCTSFGIEREGTSECDWPGIRCEGQGVHSDLDVDEVEEDDLRVVGIDAKGGGKSSLPPLEGELPMELTFLNDLETLDVSHNQITGTLDPVLFTWKHMKVLELNDNLLEGNIPSNLGYLPNLQKLTLHHNEFLGEIPSEICNLRKTSLHFLWADCSPMVITNEPKVACPVENCCTICFEGYDADGGPGTGGSNPSRPAEPSHEVGNDALQNLKDKLSTASADGGAALLNVASPQFRAYAWLVEDDDAVPGGRDDERLFQRYALATLYFATNGAHWARADGWITAADECDWYGVAGCEADDATAGGGTEEREVVSVNLKDNRLEGTIPPEAFEFLPGMVVLNLATNDLSGPIPKEIGTLKDLDILELAENQLTSIPAEMGQLNSIAHVFLQSNDFDGQEMPGDVCQLRTDGKLTLLWADCRGGDSASVRCDPECCTTCFSGDARGDGGATKPQPLTQADSDEVILDRLKKTAPDGGEALEKSTSPQFKAYSWLVGSDDATYQNLSDILLLQRYAMATLYFGLSGHEWTQKEGWLSDEGVCEWQGVLDCNGVRMVTELSLYSNNLIGRIPLEIIHLRMLETLDLTDNELYGTLPTEFGKFEDMEMLRLGGNLLTGTIPVELGNLLTLHELYLHVNEFAETSIPNEICALRTEDGNGLSTLWADCERDETGFAEVSCGDDDCCDQCFGDYSDFEYYQGYQSAQGAPTYNPTAPSGTVVPGRFFPPTLSPAVATPTTNENEQLKAQLLSHMKNSPLFVDRVSDADTHAHEAFLWLGNTGNVDELDDFHILQRYGLATFYISTNPDRDYPWKVSEGWNTDDHECDWFGVTCDEDRNSVTEISLPSNRLSGTIPPEIELVGLGSKLVKLNLSGNNIGGNIAAQIGTLKRLEVLDLKANDFTGQIPPEIGELDLLKSLELQANELTGDMPAEICALRDGLLEELIADCDALDLYSTVACEMDACCTECY